MLRTKIILLTGVFISGMWLSPVSAQTATQTFTKNGNTYVMTKTIENGTSTIVTKIYDSAGNLLDTKTVTKNVNPSPVKSYPSVYPTKPVLQTTKAPAVSPSPVPVSPTPDLQTTIPYQLKSTTPVEFTDTGKIIVDTGTKLELNTTPEQIMTSAKSAGIDSVQEFSLIEPEVGQYRFLVKGTKQERFLAMVQVKLPTTLTYNPDTGLLEKTDQTLGTKILDFLSL